MIFKQYECKREYKKYVYIFPLLLKNRIYFEKLLMATLRYIKQSNHTFRSVGVLPSRTLCPGASPHLMGLTGKSQTPRVVHDGA